MLEAFVAAAGGNVSGMDVVGDWSPVRVRGWLRRFLHLTEHPSLKVQPDVAAQCNEGTNLSLLNLLGAGVREAVPARVRRAAA